MAENEKGRFSMRSSEYQGLSTRQKITRCAMDLFGGYQRDKFADPGSFAAQALMMFEQYELAVCEYLTDPRNRDALQHRHPKFPPTVGEIRDACEDRTKTLETLRRPTTKFLPRPYVPPLRSPGCRANLLVLREAPGYDAVENVVSSGELDECDWARDPRGIRIALNIWQNLGQHVARSTFKPLSDDELRAHYGRKEAEYQAARRESENPAPAGESAP